MSYSNKLAKTVLLSILSVSTTAAIAAEQTSKDKSMPGNTDSKMEKCYGIVKAGMNDCTTHTTTCSGTSTKDGQKDAYILLPSGTCKRIVNGNLKSS